MRRVLRNLPPEERKTGTETRSAKEGGGIEAAAVAATAAQVWRQVASPLSVSAAHLNDGCAEHQAQAQGGNRVEAVNRPEIRLGNREALGVAAERAQEALRYSGEGRGKRQGKRGIVSFHSLTE